MLKFEVKLADWHQVYRQLEDARTQLKTARDAAVQARLAAQVQRLKEQSDAALDDVRDALASAHQAPTEARPR
jgi:hypothetical protein